MLKFHLTYSLGAIQVLHSAEGVGGCWISSKKCYEDVQFSIISEGLVGVEFPEKKLYVMLEWPLNFDQEMLNVSEKCGHKMR